MPNSPFPPSRILKLFEKINYKNHLCSQNILSGKTDRFPDFPIAPQKRPNKQTKKLLIRNVLKPAKQRLFEIASRHQKLNKYLPSLIYFLPIFTAIPKAKEFSPGRHNLRFFLNPPRK